MPEAITYRTFLCRLPLTESIPVGGSMWKQRPTILIEASTADGHTGWGEAAPLDGYGPDTLDQVMDQLRAGALRSTPAANDLSPSLACAVSCARAGLGARRSGHPFLQANGPSGLDWLRPARLVGGSVPIPADASTIKIKVGRHPGQDIQVVRALAAQHPDAAIRLDANRMMSRDAALALLADLDSLIGRIDFMEEPFPGCFDRDHRSDFPVPLAVDESLEGANWQHADVCILKPSLMGSIESTLALANDIRAAGRRVVVSSAWESRVGMIMLAHLAARMGDAAPGLGTYRWLADDPAGLDPVFLGGDIDMAAVSAIPEPRVRPSSWEEITW